MFPQWSFLPVTYNLCQSETNCHAGFTCSLSLLLQSTFFTPFFMCSFPSSSSSSISFLIPFCFSLILLPYIHILICSCWTSCLTPVILSGQMAHTHTDAHLLHICCTFALLMTHIGLKRTLCHVSHNRILQIRQSSYPSQHTQGCCPTVQPSHVTCLGMDHWWATGQQRSRSMY